MISVHALGEMRGYVRQGRLGAAAIPPQIHFDVAPCRVERDEHVDIHWAVTHAQRVVLRVLRADGTSADEVVPREGRRRIAMATVGRGQFAILATPQAGPAPRRQRPPVRQVVADVEVVAPKPRIHLEVGARVTLGEPIRLAWAIGEADDARLIVDGASLPVAMNDQIEIPSEACGERSVVLVARGQGGRAECARRVRVAAPPVVISAPTEVDGIFDSAVRIRYAISGARSAVLDPMEPGEAPQAIPVSGQIEAWPSLEARRIQILAEGHDGRRVEKTITVRGRCFEWPSIADELAILNQGLR